ncbi:MAG: zinc ABC transporter substrate-binding protein [Chitinispirillaceae bacterium]|nr:zinc ABC transporter substrate-binding protein [Chitinispirillaceae bacterium]
MGKRAGWLWYVGGALLCCCSRPMPGSSGKPLLFVSIPPQKYFVEKICGDYYSVKTLIPPGASPHSYEPKPSQMAELAEARIYFSIGVEMERAWLPRIKKLNPRLMVVPTDSGIVKLPADEPGAAAHGGDTYGHGNVGSGRQDHGARVHGGSDPHIWLSPGLVKLQARRITRALAATDTARGRFYRKRLAAFETEIDSLQERITAGLEECGAKRSFLVFHPSWGYFAADFSLRQIAVEAGGKEPGMKEVGEVVARAKKEGITTVLVQPQFSRKTADIIAQRMGGKTVTADPLAEDWPENLLRVTGVLCGK